VTRVERIIETLGLQPHPREGGYFVETYRSSETIPQSALPPGYSSARNHSTAIYYLLTPQTFSEMHRLPTDEIFHFYLGDPVTMLRLFPKGRSERIVLGSDLLAGEKPQLVVPRNVWQGTLLNEGGEFALLGCTVAPGFDFADYESGDREQLIAQYPAEKNWIERLTHPKD
jgi:predicted cupin superfamily sugar epimerase